jgi:hypothetical protein
MFPFALEAVLIGKAGKMSIDRETLAQDADDFDRLVEMILEDRPGTDQETAERMVIHAGHRRIEQLFAAYIHARGENSAQLKGLVDKILKGIK